MSTDTIAKPAAKTTAKARKPKTYAVVYRWEDREEVRYRRPRTDTRLAREVLELQRAARRGKQTSPYSISTKRKHIL